MLFYSMESRFQATHYEASYNRLSLSMMSTLASKEELSNTVEAQPNPRAALTWFSISSPPKKKRYGKNIKVPKETDSRK